MTQTNSPCLFAAALPLMFICADSKELALVPEREPAKSAGERSPMAPPPLFPDAGCCVCNEEYALAFAPALTL